MKVKWTPPGERIVGLNVSFSSLGLAKLGFTESLLDESFDTGQLFDARSLGDAGQTRGSYWSPSWDSEFKADIDGVFSITAHIDTEDKAKQLIAQLEAAFTEARKVSLKKIVQIRASLRDGLNEPNDFFGYRDGISKPEIEDASFGRTQPMVFKGSSVVDMGVIVMGHDGDEDRAVRPQWARDGSFMVFRKLKMLAPEFRTFVRQESFKMFPGKERGYAQDLFGARLVGRWKSGKLSNPRLLRRLVC
jgi:deferrochelatase/peroxidase EfeB